MNYLVLAKKQFNELKDETIADDPNIVGASCTKDYDINNEKFSINVDGFWEKNTHFNWVVRNHNGLIIREGIYN